MYRDYHGLLGKLIALHVIVLHWENIIALQRDSAAPELNVSYKHLSLLQDEHPKLFFGDIPLRSINKITETAAIKCSNICLIKIFKVTQVEEIYS